MGTVRSVRVFRSRRNHRNGRNFNYYLILMSIDNHAAWRRSPFCISVISVGNKKIGSSVRDKNNSHGDWRKDFYNGRNGNIRKRNGKDFCDFCVIKNIAAGDKSKKIISGIIMIIMIISFRDKTNTDHSDLADDFYTIFNFQK